MNALRTKSNGSEDPVNWLDVVRQQVGSLQFGAVEIVVHDSRVVQIEKTERLRLGAHEQARSVRIVAPSPVVPVLASQAAGAVVQPAV